MTWLQLIIQKLIQLLFHNLLGQHFIMGFDFIIRFKFRNNLSDEEKDPLRWGSVIENKMFTPIMTDIEAGPPDPLKVVR